MNPKDLRIGNLIYNGIGEVFPVNGETINNFQIGQAILGAFKPILLTEEWLQKFEFEKWQGWLCLEAFSPGHPSQRFDLYWSKKDGFMTKSRYQEDNNAFKMRHIKYVHQLQNLYFALTGTELNLNIEL